MKPTNSIYLGDHRLEPDEEDDIPDDGLTEQELRQKAFDDFDPPDCGDFGEPL